MKQSKTTPIRIREMNIYDIPEIFDLGEKVFSTEFSNIYRTWDEYEVTNAFITDGDFSLVAELDEQIVGFALGTVYEKGTAWNYGHVLWLGVDPDLHQKGVGSKLLKALKNKFIDAGARIMIVDTQSKNTKALSFFHKHGFGDEKEHLYLSCRLKKKSKKASS